MRQNRIRIKRKVLNPPSIKGFKPYGESSGKKNQQTINLLFEEYEALRLCDYDLLNHHQSSILMGVSRPTFTRIYASALQKIATAFVEGRQISIDGGKVYFDSDWYHCHNCYCYFNNPEKENEITECPLCKNHQISEYEPKPSDFIHDSDNCGGLCICIKCGFEQTHQYGKPCSQELCPACNIPMKRKTNFKK